MKQYVLASIKLTLLTMFLFGVIYPMALTGFAFLFGPGSGKGVTIEAGGRVVGFERIGQKFESPKYFHGRPSAVGYNAAATGGSNKGPSNPDYLAEVEGRINDFLAQNPGVSRQQVPVELVTASGGGLDPNVSVAGALVQIPRVARQRGLSEEAVRNLVDEHTEAPLLGLFGPGVVHVLRLNIALDNLKR